MPRVLVYCRTEGLRRELEDGLMRMGCGFDIYEDSGKFMDAALEEKPEVLALCFAADDRWAEAGIAALRKSCRDAKIIFATQKPGKEDAKSLERGVFYYAGDASSRDILGAVEAALGNPSSGRPRK